MSSLHLCLFAPLRQKTNVHSDVLLLLMLEILDHGFGAGADVELGVHGLEVVADGFVADAEVVGDFFGDHALGEAFEDLAFTRSEAGDFLLLRHDGLLEGLDEESRDLLAERGAAFAGLADADRDVGGLRGLQQVAMGSGTERGEDLLGIIMPPGRDKVFLINLAVSGAKTPRPQSYLKDLSTDFADGSDGLPSVKSEKSVDEPGLEINGSAAEEVVE